MTENSPVRVLFHLPKTTKAASSCFLAMQWSISKTFICSGKIVHTSRTKCSESTSGIVLLLLFILRVIMNLFDSLFSDLGDFRHVETEALVSLPNSLIGFDLVLPPYTLVALFFFLEFLTFWTATCPWFHSGLPQPRSLSPKSCAWKLVKDRTCSGESFEKRPPWIRQPKQTSQKKTMHLQPRNTFHIIAYTTPEVGLLPTGLASARPLLPPLLLLLRRRDRFSSWSCSMSIRCWDRSKPSCASLHVFLQPQVLLHLLQRSERNPAVKCQVFPNDL